MSASDGHGLGHPAGGALRSYGSVLQSVTRLMAKLFWHQLPRLLKQDQVELVLVSRSCGLPILYARQQDVLMPIHLYGRGQLPSLPLDQLYPRLRSLGVRRIQWWQYVTADEACAGRPQPVVQWLAF